MPLTWYAFERFHAAVLKRDSRSGHQVLHGARQEDLTRPGQGRDTHARLHGHAAERHAYHLALAGMEPRPELQNKAGRGPHDRTGTADAASRPVEKPSLAVSISRPRNRAS